MTLSLRASLLAALMLLAACSSPNGDDDHGTATTEAHDAPTEHQADHATDERDEHAATRAAPQEDTP